MDHGNALSPHDVAQLNKRYRPFAIPMESAQPAVALHANTQPTSIYGCSGFDAAICISVVRPADLEQNTPIGLAALEQFRNDTINAAANFRIVPVVYLQYAYGWFAQKTSFISSTPGYTRTILRAERAIRRSRILNTLNIAKVTPTDECHSRLRTSRARKYIIPRTNSA